MCSCGYGRGEEEMKRLWVLEGWSVVAEAVEEEAVWELEG